MSSHSVSSSMVVENGSNVSTTSAQWPDSNQNTSISCTRDNTEGTSHVHTLYNRTSPRNTSDLSEGTNLNNHSAEEPPEQEIGFPTFRSPEYSASRNALRDYFLRPPVDQQNAPIYERQINIKDEIFLDNTSMTLPQTYREPPPRIVRHRLSHATRVWSSEECSAERIRLGIPRYEDQQKRPGGQ